MAYRRLNAADWRLIFVSQGCLELTGYSPDELVGNSRISWEEITCQRDRTRVRDCINAAVQANKRFAVSYQITTLQGQEKWIMERGIGVLDEHGAMVIEGFIEDITAQRAVFEALEQAELRYRSIFDACLRGYLSDQQRWPEFTATPRPRS